MQDEVTVNAEDLIGPQVAQLANRLKVKQTRIAQDCEITKSIAIDDLVPKTLKYKYSQLQDSFLYHRETMVCLHKTCSRKEPFKNQRDW